jgi:hypothetical protein
LGVVHVRAVEVFGFKREFEKEFERGFGRVKVIELV